MDYLKIIGTYFRLGALNELEYRANFWVQMLESTVNLIVALGGLAVVFAHTETLAGWSPNQLIALVGIYTLVAGFIRLVISPSLERFMADVREGTLDFTIIKPVDAQLLVSIQRIEIWKLVDIVLGFGVIGVALARMGQEIGFVDTAVFGIAIFSGVIIVYSFWLMLATLAFWFVRTENLLVIFDAMYKAARWPVTIYPGWLRFTLTFMVPIAFAVTVPAEGLTGKLATNTLLLAVGLALAIFVVARLFWRFGIRFYSGASA